MKLHVLSDVHFEHMRSDNYIHFIDQLTKLKANSPADVAVLAGDICTIGHDGKAWKRSLARLCSLYQKVLYVPGNHEYYGNNFNDVEDFLQKQESSPDFSNLVRLDRMDTYELDGQRFIGGTMWFADQDYSQLQKNSMSDFWVIKDFEPEVYHLHKHFLAKLHRNLRKGDIVVTHHMPLPESIAPMWRGSYINDFFMSDRTQDLIEPTLPKLWIHGHTHNSMDYTHTVGTSKMRVYCNPLGYPNEGLNSQFWNKVTIDV